MSHCPNERRSDGQEESVVNDGRVMPPLMSHGDMSQWWMSDYRMTSHASTAVQGGESLRHACDIIWITRAIDESVAQK